MFFALMTVFFSVTGCLTDSGGEKKDDTGETLSYTVTGQIETSTGEGISGVSVKLNGGSTNLTVTNETNNSGSYSIINVPNGTYSVTPTKTGYTFTPSTQQVTVSGKNITISKFTGATGSVTGEYDMTGVVRDEKSAPMEFVLVTLQDTKDDLNFMAIYTNENGAYSFDNLTASTYILSFSYDEYEFPTKNITFTGTPITISPVAGTPSSSTNTYTVSGRLVDTFGAGLSGFVVTLTGGTTPIARTTDTNGNYSFAGIENGSYTITPSRENYTFAPVNINVIVSGDDIKANNIIGTPLGGGGGGTQYYVVSGTVLDNNGVPLEWTMVELKGTTVSKEDFGYTDSKGTYEINFLKNGTYALTPSFADYTFKPESLTVTINGTNVTGANFVATPVKPTGQTGTVTGKLVNGDQSITATLKGDGGTFTDETGYGGSFEFNSVPYGNYKLTFVPKIMYHIYNYTFVPEEKTVVVDSRTVSVTDVKYEQSLKTVYQVSGKVTFSANDKNYPNKGAQFVDITLTVAEGPFAGTAFYSGKTSSDGTWSIIDTMGVPNGRYKVVASSSYFGVYAENFSPSETFIVVENAPVTSVNFVMTRK